MSNVHVLMTGTRIRHNRTGESLSRQRIHDMYTVLSVHVWHDATQHQVPLRHNHLSGARDQYKTNLNNEQNLQAAKAMRVNALSVVSGTGCRGGLRVGGSSY